MQLLTPGSVTQAMTSDIRDNSFIVHMKFLSQHLIPFLSFVCWKILTLFLTTDRLRSGCTLHGNKPQCNFTVVTFYFKKNLWHIFTEAAYYSQVFPV